MDSGMTMSMSGSSMGGMSSTMSMSGSPSTTMSGMSMETMTMSSSSDMMMMGMDSMAMVFFTSTSTPLYSWSWTPTTTGQYTGTCIFLIVLAAIFRALIAIRGRANGFLTTFRQRRTHGFDYVPPKGVTAGPRQWRAGDAVTLAAFDVVLAGVSYLLMLAVMTMNVGYFMSVLGGVFLGSLVFGQFISQSAAH